ncbi:hypothetical protein L249_4299 [Ophiocordyceps polyrhachis-furcata BCC 54312]|uniref:Ribosome biogenesis protein Urb1 n=1 Tax=Ophiocordyceps polyrhachis-furcata BCC 54312 TaxID=1330021 RepID=A0A367L7G1_9HYPO|nr:hypothetical protein L249_4299 [Ophiocordyceps polyrhachis-furcata BCC 54312]
MGKRPSAGPQGPSAPRKRQRTAAAVDPPAGEHVTSSVQLRNLLVFDQDLRKARHGLQSFKKLLDDIISDQGNREDNLAILQQYLDATKPKDDSQDAVHLQDIMDMWSFAAQVNDDGVMSSVAVVLALLLRVASDSLKLVSHGLGVCQTILQERHLKCLSKNLASENRKAFIISPTLRLLRAAACLDGGAYAKSIVRASDYTFTSLSRNLELGHAGPGPEDPGKSSIRTNAVRFFLTCVKHLNSQGRKELLSQRHLFSRLTYSIKSDPPDVALEILDVLRCCVLMDSKIPREAKFRNFNTRTLLRILALYSLPGGDADKENPVSERAHEFLMCVCTTPAAGVLYPYKGLYPKELEDEQSDHAASRQAETRLDDKQTGQFDTDVPVYNFALAEFANKLRPWACTKQSQLLVAMFTAAPELIAKYLHDNRFFTFEPKDSMTWVGYAAFLFDIISIPLPPSFGNPSRYAEGPPPTSVLLDNILPPAVTHKVLVRCFSLKSDVTSLFATKILVAALEKLAVALRMHTFTQGRAKVKWMEAARRLEDTFCQRVPDMKEIVQCYRAIPADNSMHKTLASRLLLLYYRVIPRVALTANFDVSPLLSAVLEGLRKTELASDARQLSLIELESLVTIASYSPGMRWFSRTDSSSHGSSTSAFVALLQLLCGGQGDALVCHIKEALANVAVESQLVSRAAGLNPLLAALQLTTDQVNAEEMDVVWSFLDNCISRCVASPIKYIDAMETLMSDASLQEDNSSSLLNLALVEQLPYAANSGEKRALKPHARFLSLYFNACYLREGDDGLLRALHQQLNRHLSSGKAKMTDLGDESDTAALKAQDSADERDEGSSRAAGGQKAVSGEVNLQHALQVPPLEEADPTALTKCMSKSVEDVIEDGWATKLIRLLLSEHTHIRKEALTGILKVTARMKESSSYQDGPQIWLLLSELAESSRPLLESGPVPSALVAFAAHAMDVLQSPLHPLYAKVNRYLTRSPVWSPDKIPLAHDILHGEPSEDDRYYAEIAWLLTYLVECLRTSRDLDVFRAKKWFEKMLALASNPHLRAGLRNRLLAIVYRATCIHGGSTTLVTRFGVLAWLDGQRVGSDTAVEAGVCRRLMRRVWETCDQQRVAVWSHDGARKLVQSA